MLNRFDMKAIAIDGRAELSWNTVFDRSLKGGVRVVPAVDKNHSSVGRGGSQCNDRRLTGMESYA